MPSANKWMRATKSTGIFLAIHITLTTALLWTAGMFQKEWQWAREDLIIFTIIFQVILLPAVFVGSRIAQSRHPVFAIAPAVVATGILTWFLGTMLIDQRQTYDSRSYGYVLSILVLETIIAAFIMAVCIFASRQRKGRVNRSS